MSARDDRSAISLPTKPSIPPSYDGLPDAATFGRLASRPDRIHPEAEDFFLSWIGTSNIAIKRKDGRLVFRPEFAPIGYSRFVDVDATTETASSTPATTPATKK